MSLSKMNVLFRFDECLSSQQIKSWFSRRAKIMPKKLQKYLDRKGEPDVEDLDKEYEVSPA